MYADGGRIILSSSPKIIEDYFSTTKYKRFWNERHPSAYKSGMITLWRLLPHQDLFHEATQMAGIKHGIHIFGEVNDNYCESFGFATTFCNETIINNYFTNLDMLKNFIFRFHHSANLMLKAAERERVILPINNNIITLPDEINPSTDISHIYSLLTNRQQQCAHLLMKGMSAKIIARELSLSFRTVETYLHDLKIRLHCKNKTELILKLSNFIGRN